MKRAFGLLLATALVASLVGGCGSLPKKAPNFGEIEPKIGTVTVMPPTFTLLKVGAFSGESVASLTHDIEKEIMWATESIIDWSRYDLARLEVGDEALAANSELRSALFAQGVASANAFAACAKTSGKQLQVDYEADIDYFADLTGSDYFIFPRGDGFFKTTGAQVKEAVVATAMAVLFGGGGMGPTTGTSLELIVVDAVRGKVIWYNRKQLNEKDPRKPSHLFNSCKAALEPLLGPITLKADKSQDRKIIDKYKDEFGEEVGDAAKDEAHPELKEDKPTTDGVF